MLYGNNDRIWNYLLPTIKNGRHQEAIVTRGKTMAGLRPVNIIYTGCHL